MLYARTPQQGNGPESARGTLLPWYTKGMFLGLTDIVCFKRNVTMRLERVTAVPLRCTLQRSGRGSHMSAHSTGMVAQHTLL